MGFMPELWADKTLNQLLNALKSSQRIVNSVTDYTPFTIGRKASGYNGPKLGALTVQGLPVTTPDNPSQTAINFSFDQKRGVVFQLSDIDRAQASVDMLASCTEDAVNALLDDYDTFLLGKMIDGLSGTSGFKNTISDTTGHKLSLADIRVARKKLNAMKAPLQGRYMAVDPDFENDLYDIEGFISRDKIADTSAMKDGVVGRVMGFDVLLAAVPKVTNAWSRTAGTLPVALFYSSFSTAFGRQKEFESKSSPDAKIPGDIVNIYSVYGGAIQDDTMIVGFRRDV